MATQNETEEAGESSGCDVVEVDTGSIDQSYEGTSELIEWNLASEYVPSHDREVMAKTNTGKVVFVIYDEELSCLWCFPSGVPVVEEIVFWAEKPVGPELE